MKYGTKKIITFVIIALAIFWGITNYRAMTGDERRALDGIGRSGKGFWIHVLNENFILPSNDFSPKESWPALLQKQWDVTKLDMKSRFCDANVWTVIKNGPENPPKNLIVLATRNIDPSSLRTSFTDKDMHKHIRFDEQFVPPEKMPILSKYAVAIRADCRAVLIPVVPPTSGKAEKTMYKYIYTHMPSFGEEDFFDLTTNLVNGRLVSYFTPDGKTVIPTND